MVPVLLIAQTSRQLPHSLYCKILSFLNSIYPRSIANSSSLFLSPLLFNSVLFQNILFKTRQLFLLFLQSIDRIRLGVKRGIIAIFLPVTCLLESSCQKAASLTIGWNFINACSFSKVVGDCCCCFMLLPLLLYSAASKKWALGPRLFSKTFFYKKLTLFKQQMITFFYFGGIILRQMTLNTIFF